MRLTLLLLLLALTLTSTVSYAQGGDQGAGNEPQAVVEPLALDPEPEPPPGPPAISLPPAEPGEQQFIAEVTIGSAEQLAALQQLGYSCDEGAMCEIVASEAHISALQEAGFALDIVGVVVQSWHENGGEESYVYGHNSINVPVPDHGSATSIINISGAPSTGRVTQVKYECRVDTWGDRGGPGSYTLDLRAFMSSAVTIWNRLGGLTDEGHDDDAQDDKDIHLINRWINSDFDGQLVNQPWVLTVTDHTAGLEGGQIDYWSLWVYYNTPGPPVAPTLIAPGNTSNTCDTTPAFDWSSVSGATGYQIQVDDQSSFPSPAIDATPSGSSYTPSSALARRRWYWRVRARDAVSWSSWSATWTFYIDSVAGVPVLVAPANGTHTCDSTPYFDWQTAVGAASYRIQVDDSSGFVSPVINTTTGVSNYTPGSALPPGQYYWRVRGENTCTPSAWSSLRDFYLDPGPATPSGPSPADGATGVGLATDLDWSSSAGATTYDVYFGTSSTPPFVANVSGSQHTLPTLAANTRYYWKVVAKNSCGTEGGPVWSFTTGGYAPTPTDTATSTPTPTQSPTPTPTRTPTLGPVGTHRVYLPMVLKQSPGVLRITLGQNNIERGLSMGTARDADTEVVLVGNPATEARRTGNGQPLPAVDGNQIEDYYLQIRVDDSQIYAGSPTSRVLIELEYLDLGTDTFDLTYDALPRGPSDDGRFKLAGGVAKGDTGRFRMAGFVLCDANFANRDNNADFRIGDNADGPETIRSISVIPLSPGPCGG